MLSLQKHFENKTHIIWDWNGTLINDLDLCVEITGQLLGEHGLPELGRDRHRDRFRIPVKDFYEELGFDLEKVSYESLALEFARRYRRAVTRCSLYHGAKDLLELLKTKEKRQAILSAANEETLKELVLHYDIHHFFDLVCGLGDHLAASKVERGRELLAHWGVESSRIVLVGDMDHDVEVARELGIEALLLADGHQSFHRLKAFHPNTLETRY